MLKRIESIINKSPFYNILRFNPISSFILELKNKKIKKSVEFYSSFLQRAAKNKLVYDIGANKGNKVHAFLKMGFSVIALEPEKKALSTLHWRFGRNKRVTIIEKGVSDTKGELNIHITEGRSGLNTLSDKWMGSLEDKKSNRWHKHHDFKKSYTVEVTTADDLFQQYGFPFFMKIDVEGYENKVIKGISQAPPFLSFETNLPEFVNETIECIQHISGLSGKTMYNYSIADKLELENWIGADEIIKVIKDPAITYMEIISRTT